MNLLSKIAAYLTLMGCFCSAAHGQDETLPEKPADHFRYLVGTWDYSYEFDGKTYHGEWKAAMTANEMAMTGNFEETGRNGFVRGSTLAGWDASKKQLVSIGFVNPGGYQSTRFDFETAEILNGTMKGSLASGESWTQKFRFERSKLGFTYKIFETMKAGKPQPDVLMTFMRRKN